VLDPYKSKSGHGSERLLLQFFLKQVFPVLGRLFPLVRDDAGCRWRQSRVSRAAASFDAFVQFLFAFAFHPKLTCAAKSQSEREGHLKIKAAIGCGITVRPAREAVGFAE